MKKLLTILLATALIGALAAPSVALAKGGNSHGRNTSSHGKKFAAQASAETTPVTKAERKAAKTAARIQRKAAKVAAKTARKAARPSVEGSESVEPTESVESSVGAGIPNAFARITSNLEKSLAKIAAGKKAQLPPGLVSVWQKFAGWLGIDLTTQPGFTGSTTPTATPVPTSTVEPSATVAPTGTIVPVPAQ